MFTGPLQARYPYDGWCCQISTGAVGAQAPPTYCPPSSLAGEGAQRADEGLVLRELKHGQVQNPSPARGEGWVSS